MTVKKMIDNHLFFVDESVKHLLDFFEDKTLENRIFVLDTHKDGVKQITRFIQEFYLEKIYKGELKVTNQTDVETVKEVSISIMAHGSPGCLKLGSTELSLSTLALYDSEIKSWYGMDFDPASYCNAHLNLYSCKVAVGDAGAEFIQKLHQMTGATIYSSTTDIGHKSLGGNWTLDTVVPTPLKTVYPSTPFIISKDIIENFVDVLADPVATDNVLSVNKGDERKFQGNLIQDDDGFGSDSDGDGDTLRITHIDGIDVTSGPETISTQYGSITVEPDGSYTYTLDTNNPDAIVAGNGHSLTDMLTYTLTDGNSVATAKFTITINGNDSFPSNSNLFYQTISGDLAFYNPLTQDYQNVSALSIDVNAAAYNPIDNFIYATAQSDGTDDFGNDVEQFEIVRIDRRGQVEGVGVLASDTLAGDFDDQGHYWIRNNNSNKQLLRVDIPNNTKVTFDVPKGVREADLVFLDGKLYGASGNGKLRIYDIYNPRDVGSDNLVIDRSEVVIQGLPSGGTGVYGAAWADRQGNLYLGYNGGDHDFDPIGTPDSGAIIKVGEYNSALPTAEVEIAVAETGTNDGASDHGGLSPFIAPFIDLGQSFPSIAEVTFTEDGAAVDLFSDVGIIDPDEPSNTIARFTIQISGIADGADEILYVDGQPILLSEDSVTPVSIGGTAFVLDYRDGQFSITASGDNELPMAIADVELLLDGLKYENKSDHPSSNNRGLIITLTDGNDNLSQAVGIVHVNPLNDLPILDLDSSDGTSQTGVEQIFQIGGDAVAIATQHSTISDVDDTQIESATITLTNALAGDQLLLDGQNVLDGDGTFTTPSGVEVDYTATSTSGKITIELTKTALLDDYEAVIEAIAFNNTEASPDGSDRVIKVVVNDGDDDSNTATSVITIAPPAPTITISGPIAGDNQVDDTEDDRVIISGNTSGVEQGQQVTVQIRDSSNTVVYNGTALVDDQGNWSIPDADLSDLDDSADFTITADVQDVAGNDATQATHAITTIDSTAPTITISGPIAGDNQVDDNEEDSVTISGSTSGVEEGQEVTVKILDSSGNEVYDGTATVDDQGNWSIPDANLSDLDDSADFTITADVQDAAGNDATQATHAIATIDSTVPTITISGPIAGDNQVDDDEDDSVIISGNTSGVEQGQQVTVQIRDSSNTVVYNGTALVDDQGNWSIPDANLSTLDDNANFTITADVTDAAGNDATQATHDITTIASGNSNQNNHPTEQSTSNVPSSSSNSSSSGNHSSPSNSSDSSNSSSSITPSSSITHSKEELDSDGDGIPDNRDPDDDNDGILDTVEEKNSIDTDGDGIPNSLDQDSDNDGIPDAIESSGERLDTDNDGIPDYQDLDSDNDGIPDVIEGGGSDPDRDGIIGKGIPKDADGDGLADDVDKSTGGTPLPVNDLDGDRVPDYQDLDSDNDGVFDLIERGGLVDLDNNGRADGGDSDGDGLLDVIDVSKNTFGSGTGPIDAPQDTDGNGIPDFQDLPQISQHRGSGGSDNITGTKGKDILNGFSDLDVLNGGKGNDIINGGSQKDILIGGPGHDVLNGGTNDDQLLGKKGKDLLNGGSGHDKLVGHGGHDLLNGGEGDDRLRGGQGRDILNGEDGNDILLGQQKKDQLKGGEGDDLLVGGRGKDILSGGEGRDTFRYLKTNEFGDVITDFEIIKDMIDLSRVRGINSMRSLSFFQRGDRAIVKAWMNHRFKTVVHLENIDINDLNPGHFKF